MATPPRSEASWEVAGISCSDDYDEPDIDYDESPPFEIERGTSPVLPANRRWSDEPSPAAAGLSSPVFSRQSQPSLAGSQSPRPKSFLFKKPATVGGFRTGAGNTVSPAVSLNTSMTGSNASAVTPTAFAGSFAVSNGPKDTLSASAVQDRQPVVPRTEFSAWNSVNYSDRPR